MKAKPTERQKKELSRRKAMGISVIQHPLRFIAARTNTLEADAKGVMQKVESKLFKSAQYFASAGCGGEVKRLAQQAL